MRRALFDAFGTTGQLVAATTARGATGKSFPGVVGHLGPVEPQHPVVAKSFALGGGHHGGD